MATTRTTIIKQAQAWIGCRESDGSHKMIIDTYNKIKPLPRGYKVRYTDEWCATFISALGYTCGALDIIPAECSCSRMIQGFKALGCWQESDSYTPMPGDILFYDWDDSGRGENRNNPDHVGIVENVSNGTITVIEGNKGEAVARRYIKINGRYIRGYGLPKYLATTNNNKPTTTINNEVKTVNITLNQLSRGSTGTQVKTLQRLLMALGYNLGGYGADGDFGSATDSAVRKFQKDKRLSVDGIVGTNTWNALLK